MLKNANGCDSTLVHHAISLPALSCGVNFDLNENERKFKLAKNILN